MNSPLLEVGRVVKPHGLRGEVVVEMLTNRGERLEPGSVLTAGDRSLEVRSARPHAKRWLMTFEGVADRDAADQLRDAVLRAEPIEDPDALWVHELIGLDVVDTGGERLGRVESVEANPASDLLVLDGGGLIPLRFVVEVGDEIEVDVPQGLL